MKRGDRVEWNPTGDVWEPATVWAADDDNPVHVVIVLDWNRECLLVERRHCRPEGGEEK